jgi:hypothetical protein
VLELLKVLRTCPLVGPCPKTKDLAQYTADWRCEAVALIARIDGKKARLTLPAWEDRIRKMSTVMNDVHYCSGHLADGDYAAEGCCCEGGERCDSCGMHEDPSEVDFARAAAEGTRAERPRDPITVLREPIEQALREVERQWRDRLGWRARLELVYDGRGFNRTMLAWWHLECHLLGWRGWIRGFEYLGMVLVGPSPTAGALYPVDSNFILYESLAELPGALASFLRSPTVGERLARMFGVPREKGGRR